MLTPTVENVHRKRLVQEGYVLPQDPYEHATRREKDKGSMILDKGALS